MKHTAFFKAASITLAAAAAAACFAGCGGNNYADKNTEYYIGASGPLTGGAAIYGTAVKNAAQMAVEEINAAGGVNGSNFKFVMTDDQHDATKVAANYATLFEGGMQVSLGCVTTKPCLEFKGYAVQDEVFSLCPSASGDDVTKDCDNFFQMCFADSGQGAGAAQFVKETYTDKSSVKIGILYKSGDDYSVGIFNKFKAEMGANYDGYEVVEASFTDENTFDSQVQTLKDCTFFFMPIYYTPAKNFMLAAKGQVANNAVYFGCDGFDGIDAIEGFEISQIPQEVSMLSHFNSNATEGKAKEFVDKYVKKYGKDTLNQFGASAYDCVYAIKAAIEKAVADGEEVPVNIAPADMNKVLTKVFTSDSFSFTGATGTNVKWNADGTVNKAAVKYIVKAANVA